MSHLSKSSISIFLHHSLITDKCFILMQTQLQLDIWLQSYEGFVNAKNNIKQKEFEYCFANISKTTSLTSESFLLIMSHMYNQARYWFRNVWNFENLEIQNHFVLMVNQMAICKVLIMWVAFSRFTARWHSCQRSINNPIVWLETRFHLWSYLKISHGITWSFLSLSPPNGDFSYPEHFWPKCKFVDETFLYVFWQHV